MEFEDAPLRKEEHNISRSVNEVLFEAVKNNWNLHDLSAYSVDGYLYDGKPEIGEVMKKIIEMFGVPEGEL